MQQQAATCENNAQKPDIVFQCPYCNQTLIVDSTEINCGIFRHAFDTHSGKQADPHTTKEEMKLLLSMPHVIGCGNAFQIRKGIVSACSWEKQQAS